MLPGLCMSALAAKEGLPSRRACSGVLQIRLVVKVSLRRLLMVEYRPAGNCCLGARSVSQLAIMADGVEHDIQ